MFHCMSFSMSKLRLIVWFFCSCISMQPAYCAWRVRFEFHCERIKRLRSQLIVFITSLHRIRCKYSCAQALTIIHKSTTFVMFMHLFASTHTHTKTHALRHRHNTLRRTSCAIKAGAQKLHLHRCMRFFLAVDFYYCVYITGKLTTDSNVPTTFHVC